MAWLAHQHMDIWHNFSLKKYCQLFKTCESDPNFGWTKMYLFPFPGYNLYCISVRLVHFSSIEWINLVRHRISVHVSSFIAEELHDKEYANATSLYSMPHLSQMARDLCPPHTHFSFSCLHTQSPGRQNLTANKASLPFKERPSHHLKRGQWERLIRIPLTPRKAA